LEGGGSWFSLDYNARGQVRRVNTSYSEILKSAAYNEYGQPLQTVYGDSAQTTATSAYDARNRLDTYALSRASASIWNTATPTYPVPPALPNGRQTSLLSLRFIRDLVGNPTSISDLATASQWPAGAKPVSKAIGYDTLYRATSTAFTYTGGNTWVSPLDAERAAGSREFAPLRTATTRVAGQTLQYDWKGNIVSWTDPSSMFYERSLGAAGTIGYDAARPNQLVSASGVSAVYEEAGNLGELRVSRATGSCPTGSSSFCGQQYRYDWDEVGQLQRARRWDYTRSVPAGNPAYPGVPAAAPVVDVTFSYSGGQRVLKQSADALGPMYSLEVFDSLRVNRTRLREGEYERSAESEVGYLAGFGKVIHSTTLPSPSGNPRHVFLTLGDQLGSASVVIDRESSEVVEKVTYMSYGAVESDYRPSRWQQQREEYKYTSKEEDIDIGLVYFGARYYHPRLGRFISADPLTIHAGGANSNPYAYVSGRVYTHTDPLGLDEQRFVPDPAPLPTPPPGPPEEVVVVGPPRPPADPFDPFWTQPVAAPGRADNIMPDARALPDSVRLAVVKGGEHAKDAADYAKSAARVQLGLAAGILMDDGQWLLEHTERFQIGATVGALVLGSLGAASGGGEGGALGLAGGPAAEVTVPAGAVAGAIVEGAAGAALGHEIGGNAEKALRIWASKGGGGTPKDAKKAVDRGQGPNDIKRIDKPESSVTGSQWHAHQTKVVNGKNPALNQDGSSHDGQPSFSARTLEWLQSFGWNIGK